MVPFSLIPYTRTVSCFPPVPYTFIHYAPCNSHALLFPVPLFASFCHLCFDSLCSNFPLCLLSLHSVFLVIFLLFLFLLLMAVWLLIPFGSDALLRLLCPCGRAADSLCSDPLVGGVTSWDRPLTFWFLSFLRSFDIVLHYCWKGIKSERGGKK